MQSRTGAEPDRGMACGDGRGATSRQIILGLFESWLDEFSNDSAPVPLLFVIPAGADKVEHDATETELGEMSLHKKILWCAGLGFVVGFCFQGAFHKRNTCRGMKFSKKLAGSDGCSGPQEPASLGVRFCLLTFQAEELSGLRDGRIASAT